MKLLFSALLLFILYTVGFDRVEALLEAADKAVRTAYDKAVPPEPVVPRRRNRSRSPRPPAALPPAELPTHLETL